MSSSKTAITTNPTTKTTGTTHLSPITVLKSTAASCNSFFQRLFSPAPTPCLNICGIAATETDIKHAVKHLAGRVKRSERKLQKSAPQIARVTKQQSTITSQAREISRLRGCRNQWRRIAETQTSQTWEVERDITVTGLNHRVDDLRTSLENLTAQREAALFGFRAVDNLRIDRDALRVDRDALRVENQQMAEELAQFRKTETAMEEYRKVPILLNPLVLSPVEDMHACAVARHQALMESAMVAAERETRKPVRAASVSIDRVTLKRWWNGEGGERKQPKGALTR